mgnify:CR=1 FL=1
MRYLQASGVEIDIDAPKEWVFGNVPCKRHLVLTTFAILLKMRSQQLANDGCKAGP